MSNPIKNNHPESLAPLKPSKIDDPKTITKKEEPQKNPSPKFDSFHGQHTHNPNDKRTQYDGQIMAGISAVRGMLSRILASFSQSVSNVNAHFRIALNSAAYFTLQTAVSIVQSVLDLATSVGSSLKSGATGLYTSITILLGITKGQMEEQKNIAKGDQELRKGFNDTAKMA